MTMTMCDQCGQTDDHPKVHVVDFGSPDPDLTLHHDCQSVGLLARSTQEVQDLAAVAASGVHGDDLRNHIESQKKEA